jgi:hypothetical protein
MIMATKPKPKPKPQPKQSQPEPDTSGFSDNKPFNPNDYPPAVEVSKDDEAEMMECLDIAYGDQKVVDELGWTPTDWEDMD